MLSPTIQIPLGEERSFDELPVEIKEKNKTVRTDSILNAEKSQLGDISKNSQDASPNDYLDKKLPH